MLAVPEDISNLYKHPYKIDPSCYKLSQLKDILEILEDIEDNFDYMYIHYKELKEDLFNPVPYICNIIEYTNKKLYIPFESIVFKTKWFGLLRNTCRHAFPIRNIPGNYHPMIKRAALLNHLIKHFKLLIISHPEYI